MEIKILPYLPSKSPPLTIPVHSNLSIRAPAAAATTRIHNQFFFLRRKPSSRLNATNSTSSDETPPPPAAQPPTITPPDTVEIKFKRGSRRRNRKQKGDGGVGVSQSVKAQASAPKKWEDMSLSEKAIELYVGEKGALFWLNKFAYASIFIVIGGWILFRFVGPSLNLYQLDTAPLSPSSILKGS
ncbi:hypothetical protein SADUNF_Sadunf05G0084900 [Salix dunnii]|uniref:Uncharacterized protein n=1 Tax=Salix dunnii TaxID=1413687 RepID=A0A835K7F6_9ROSI|nr:hypothetical protein SADUNF_Sadunf05G0084900 [Salix dunnii]